MEHYWFKVSLDSHIERNQNELCNRLKTKTYFRVDFNFNVVSASVVRHRNDAFIYTLSLIHI